VIAIVAEGVTNDKWVAEPTYLTCAFIRSGSQMMLVTTHLTIYRPCNFRAHELYTVMVPQCSTEEIRKLLAESHACLAESIKTVARYRQSILEAQANLIEARGSLIAIALREAAKQPLMHYTRRTANRFVAPAGGAESPIKPSNLAESDPLNL